MRFSCIAPLLLLCLAIPALALKVSVTSDPPGATVFASPADEPVMYQKGVTPCSVALDGARGPHTLLLRKAGYFPSYPAVPGEGGAAVGVLLSRDDPAAWRRLAVAPGLMLPERADVRGGEEDRGEGLPEGAGAPGGGENGDEEEQAPPDAEPGGPPGAGGAPLPAGTVGEEEFLCWAPDGSGVLYRANPRGPYASGPGLAARDEGFSGYELWWVPLNGAQRLLWRLIEPGSRWGQFLIDAAFSPNPRWLAHSSPAENRERLELRCLSSPTGRVIADDRSLTFFSPSFSPDGRLVACLCEASWETVDGARPEPGVSVVVMRWAGEDRRTVARDAEGAIAPSFSPDGSRLAYVTSGGAVAILNLATGRSEVVLGEEAWQPSGPLRWSPDGRRIAADFHLGDMGPRRAPDPDVPPRRVSWAAADGSGVGHIRAVALYEWHDEGSLEVYAPGFDSQAHRPLQRVLHVGLDAEVIKPLRRQDGGEAWFTSLAPTVVEGAK